MKGIPKGLWIILWGIITIFAVDAVCWCLTATDGTMNVLGVVGTLFWITVSLETKCFTIFKKTSKNE